MGAVASAVRFAPPGGLSALAALLSRGVLEPMTRTVRACARGVAACTQGMRCCTAMRTEVGKYAAAVLCAFRIFSHTRAQIG